MLIKILLFFFFPFSEKTHFLHAENVIQKNAKGTIKLAIPGKDSFYSLEGVGVDIWQTLTKPKTLTEIILFLQKEYPDVNKQDITQDTKYFLKELYKSKLIITR